jgi:rhodanese-related sulfurtransferase
MPKDINAKTLKKWLDSNKDFLLIDARDPKNYNVGHIPGAFSLLLSEIDKHGIDILKKGKDIVVYSKDINCPASGLVSKKLDELGYGPVYNYNPSYRDWVDKGYPVEN